LVYEEGRIAATDGKTLSRGIDKPDSVDKIAGDLSDH